MLDKRLVALAYSPVSLGDAACFLVDWCFSLVKVLLFLVLLFLVLLFLVLPLVFGLNGL